MKSRISVFLCLVMLAVIVTGCTRTNTNTATETSAASASQEEGLSGQIVIVHAISGEAKNELWLQLQEEFSRLHPNVTFDSSGMNYDAYMPLIRTKVAAGDMPDLFTGTPIKVSDIVEAGMVMELSKEGLTEQLPLKDSVWEECTFPDGIFGVPYSLQTFSLFYNKDIFEKYGIQIPKTNTEFLAVCKTLADNGVSPFIRANKEYTHTYVELKCELVPRLRANGNGDYYRQLMSGAKKFTDYPEFRASVDNMLLRYQWDRLDDVSNDFNKAAQLFAQGEGAMWLGLQMIVASAMENNPNINMGSFPFPFSDDPSLHKNVIEMNDGFMVGKTTQVKEEVFEFIKFMYQPEIAQRWAEVAGLVMVQDGINVSNMPAVTQDLVRAKESGEAVQNCIPQPVGEFVPKWRSYLQAWLSDKNTRTTDKLINEGQAIYDEIIASTASN